MQWPYPTSSHNIVAIYICCEGSFTFNSYHLITSQYKMYVCSPSPNSGPHALPTLITTYFCDDYQIIKDPSINLYTIKTNPNHKIQQHATTMSILRVGRVGSPIAKAQLPSFLSTSYKFHSLLFRFHYTLSPLSTSSLHSLPHSPEKLDGTKRVQHESSPHPHSRNVGLFFSSAYLPTTNY